MKRRKFITLLGGRGGCVAARSAGAESHEDRSYRRIVHWKSPISALLPCL
jgi:hypothetical protein